MKKQPSRKVSQTEKQDRGDTFAIGAPCTQAEKFEAAARDLGTDESEDAFKGVLRKLAKPKA